MSLAFEFGARGLLVQRNVQDTDPESVEAVRVPSAGPNRSAEIRVVRVALPEDVSSEVLHRHDPLFQVGMPAFNA